MFDLLKRRKLVRQGLASGKTRRQASEHDLVDRLRSGPTARFAILATFAAGLGFLIFHTAHGETAKSFLLGFLVLLTAVAQLWVNHPATFRNNAHLSLVFGVCLAHLALVKVVYWLDALRALPGDVGGLLYPFAFAPLVLSVLLGRNHGIFATIFCSLWGALLLPELDPVFLVTGLICGFVAVFTTLQVRRRSRLIRAGFYVGLSCLVLSLVFGKIGPIQFENLAGSPWGAIGLQAVAAVLTGLFTAMLVGGALPMLENLFGITTDISWIETADLNHPLLRQMTLEAPGTYHHSLVVANLAESAAEAVGANPLICRVGSYFHDVGKLVKPEYFAENMGGADNPHDELTPNMSALIILAHVKEGVDLALKHKLNRVIIDVIRQHHGTGLVAYFFHRACRQQKEAKEAGKIANLREEDVPEVSEESFRYPGPKPQFKEAGIIMLADAVESASRSLERPTPGRIEQLINEMIDERIASRQLDDCNLTLRDLRAIAERFRFTLQTMMHSRIAYPKEPKDEPKPEERLGRPGVPPASAA